MCLIIDRKSNKDSIDNYIKIAKKDIVVYKKLRSYGENYETPIKYYYVSKDGDILTTNSFSTNKNRHYIYVNRGIHSYTNKEYGKSIIYFNNILVKCIIPKGTPYIISNRIKDEIVSLILIIPPIDKKSIVCKKIRT